MLNQTSQKECFKVLVTAFACSPDHGSEPGIGWGWVVALSKVCDLTVLTTTCNRPGVESYEAREDPVDARFIYEDVSSFSKRLNLKAKSKIGVLVRLFLWQRRTRAKLKNLVDDTEYDILHHLTLGSFRMPFSVTGHGVTSVVGPVGGCELFPANLLPEVGAKIRFRELARNALTRVQTQLGFGMARFRNVDLTLSCTREMSRVLQKWGVESPVFPNIGMSGRQVQSEPKDYEAKKVGEPLRLFFVGNLLYWKGLDLALQALQLLPDEVRLCCVGSGKDRASLEEQIRSLGLDDRVELLGSISRAELLVKYAEYDVFLFLSLHDSGGMAVIEAMRAGLPVICLDAGGPSLSVDSECGRVVQLGPKREVIVGIRNAVRHYLEHPEDIAKHGDQARMRVANEYNWETNAKRMVEHYKAVLSRGSLAS